MRRGVGSKSSDFCLPKGAVIGPLVVCGAVFEENDLARLRAIGVKDSKMLSPAQRERLYARIRQIAKLVVVEKLESWEIDEKRGAGINLNRQETIKFLDIINKSFAGTKPDRVVIDAPDPNLPKFRLLLGNLIKREGLEIIAEHYADSNYAECSAASIVAKVTRDAAVEGLKAEYGDFGAGYPSDPKCVRWLKNRLAAGALPKIVRHSWETVSELAKNRSQTRLAKFAKGGSG